MELSLTVILVYQFMQIDNATFTQKKAYALALSIILTLRVPEVIDKLEDILRYIFIQRNNFYMYYIT